MDYYFINNRIVPQSDALISVLDLGLLRGYGVFDFFKVHEGVPVFEDDHITRFLHSAQLLHMQSPFSHLQIKNIVKELIEKNKIHDGTIRLVLTGGISSNGFTMDGLPGFLVLPAPLSFKIFTSIDQVQPYRLMTLNYIRETPEIKSLNYLIPMKHWPEVLAGGFQDVLYVQDGFISESSRANIFFITPDNVLVTPTKHVLFGITRKYVLSLAAQFMKVEERPITLQEALECREAFLSSTTKQVMPVQALDGHLIHDGLPGPMTKKLFETFYAFELKHIAQYKVKKGLDLS